jgi:colanic acid biosynthesis glycosyl transferase WcaI
MRILFLNQYYVPDVAATGQLLADVAEDLVVQGHEVHVICSRRTYRGGVQAFAKNEVAKGVHIHRVGATGFGRSRKIGRLLDWLSFYMLAMWRALRLKKMDVCVAMTTPPFIALIAFLLSKFKGTRSVIWAMDLYPDIAVAYDVLSRKSLLFHMLTRLNIILYRNAAAVISLGETMTDRLQSLGVPRDRVHTVHNWVPGEVM